VSPAEVVAVVLLGGFVGLDVASVPQVMFSRPIVAGLLGGTLVGHPLPGLAIGAVLELFALDTLPVGATRNPDWGPGSVAAGALAASHTDGFPASGFLGLVLVAVVAAWAGGWMVHLVRRANVAAVVARRDALDRGDLAAIRAIQGHGLLRDAGRSLALTMLALALGDQVSTLFAARWAGPQAVAQLTLAATSIGGALVAGLRLAGQGAQRIWLLAGLGVGLAAAGAWLR
jgi:mannose/fructose/N-acetylgalactosamine-specific phosphotransferase system component IIC